MISPNKHEMIERDVSYRALTSLISGINWITRHLDLLAPRDLQVAAQMKAPTELAMFYGYTARWRPHMQRELALVKHFLVDLFDDLTLAHWLRRLPCNYPHYATGYLALRAAGERFPSFEEAISYVRLNGYPRIMEKTPFQELGSQHRLWKAGLRAKPPTLGATFRATSFGRGQNPIYLSVPEAYSITHTLFYVTDICGPPVNMSLADRHRATDLVGTLLIHYWRKRDWDLSGELLLNLVALDQWDTPLFQTAFDALLKAQRDDGAVPGPQFMNLTQPNRKVSFDNCYHTTLVAMFLCRAYLHRTKRHDSEADAS